MSLLNALFAFLKELVETLFASSSSPEQKKRHDLKQLQLKIKEIDPPLYRPDGFLLASFPAALYQMYQFIAPIREILSATLASTDKRISEKYRDFLIESSLATEQLALRRTFLYQERIKALIASHLSPERVIEEQAKQFSQFIKALDTPQVQQSSRLIEKLFCLHDFCQFDFNSFFANFDPAFKTHAGQDTTVENPSFKPVEVAEIVPQLMDLHYLVSRLEISKQVIETVAELESKRTNDEMTPESHSRIDRIFQALMWLLQKKLSADTLLTIIRLTKNDPDFKPEQPSLKIDHIADYREHITEFFHSDSRKLQKEQQENEIKTLIEGAFGNRPLETIAGYNESTAALLQDFTPFSLDWVKPLEIIKTFSIHHFTPHYRQILKSIIVEGYFNNRNLQSSFAGSFSFCESIPAKLREFEQLFEDNQPCSLKIMTGYLTEMQNGLDFEKPLRKMVENMNNHAKGFVQQAVTQLSDVFNFCIIILEDNKKTIPDYITNIRNLTASTKNSESFAWIEKEHPIFRNFLEIMKKYAIVGTLSVSSSVSDQSETREP
ncbi:DUF5312 family protein [Treponema zuelzerae]|uniref:DUF5312 family protein n=1 Tax=Teretinema zuelzerae TaxID=156 RepID=A0AAE3EIG5_9SPIR|nr:DUF5312 family protein [Teretinema zuelzerae]MCD1654381.1 DUF5312 family protein [Teretinema zuelzerae]